MATFYHEFSISNIVSLIADVALGQKCQDSDKSCAYILTSPLGHVYTNACPSGLHCVKLYGDTSYDNIDWDTKVDFIRASNLMPSNQHAKQLKKWLQMYFSNPLKCEETEITFCGLEDYGDFNSKIWMTIKDTCPPGELMSYSELASRSGYGFGASKVVGYAINKNPYMLVVGDHRVVKATGEIWCENESQRNKLRRLLVNYEFGFTNETLDEALLRVKERNQSSKGTRKRNTAVESTKRNSKPKIKSETKVKTEKAATSRGIKKEKVIKKRAAPTRKSSRRRKRDETSEEETEPEDDSFIDDE